MTRCRAHLSLMLALGWGFLMLPRFALAASENAGAAGEQKSPVDKATDTGKESETSSKTKLPTLADKIAPVSGNLFLKAGRVEISPGVGISLDDPFFQKYTFGLKLAYHFAESFSVGLHGSYALSTAAGSVSVCKSGTCQTPTLDQLKNLPGRINFITGLDFAWSPLYGKVNIFAEKVLHFDTAIMVGADLVQYKENGQDYLSGGGHVGLGERFFLSPNVTLRLELRDYLYSAKAHLGDSTSRLENQLMFELGVSFFVGSSQG